jgi:hypothetical protein
MESINNTAGHASSRPHNLISTKPGSGNHFIYAGIALTVVLFNLIAVYGPQILLHDDPAGYADVLERKIPWYLMKHTLISPFTEWAAWNVMAYSAALARGLYVLFLMVPISWCFFYILHSKFGLSRLTSLTAAILPNILPWQWQIPAGINMSYPLWGLLFFLLSVILSLHYLEKDGSRNWAGWLGAVTCYAMAAQIMEQALFLFPPLAFTIWGFKGLNRKTRSLIFSLMLVATARFIQTLVLPRQAVSSIPLAEIMERLGLYFKWSLPSPDIKPLYLAIGGSAVIIMGFVLWLLRSDIDLNVGRLGSHLTRRQAVLLTFGVFLCWSISTIFVFIFMSEFFVQRYTYLSAFGLNALFVVSIHGILTQRYFRKLKLHLWIFLVIIVFSGVFRYANLNSIYAERNRTKSILVRDLSALQMPRNSQVAVTGVSGVPGGWRRSSGYLKHILEREDIDGLIGPFYSSAYYNYDDHFDPRLKGWDQKSNMRGLSLNRPLFLFTLDDKNAELKQLEYALQWKGEKLDAPWTIFQIDKITGKAKPFRSGTGMPEYLSAVTELEKKAILQSSILWGGPPTPEEQERLTGGKSDASNPPR